MHTRRVCLKIEMLAVFLKHSRLFVCHFPHDTRKIPTSYDGRKKKDKTLPFFPLLLPEEVSQKLLYVSQTSLIYMWGVLFRKSEDIRHCELRTLLFWFGNDCCIRFCREPLESQRERSAPRSLMLVDLFEERVFLEVEGICMNGKPIPPQEVCLLDNQRDEIEFMVMP